MKKDPFTLHPFTFLTPSTTVHCRPPQPHPTVSPSSLLSAQIFVGLNIVQMKWIGHGGMKLHTQLAMEIDPLAEGAMAAMEQTPLMKSVVCEAFRIDPPVSLQFGKAKRDMVIESRQCFCLPRTVAPHHRVCCHYVAQPRPPSPALIVPAASSQPRTRRPNRTTPLVPAATSPPSHHRSAKSSSSDLFVVFSLLC